MAVALLTDPAEGWLDQVLEDFERAMLRRRMAPGTVRIYRWAIGDLFELMKSRGLSTIQQLDRHVLEAWQDAMVARNLRPRSQQSATTAARQLINWAADWDALDLKLLRALAKVRTPDGDPRPIPEEDLDRILAYLLPRWPHMGAVALRDRALFIYILTTAARVSEALQARRDDFAAPVVIQKGGSKQTLRPAPIALEMIREYLALRIDDSPWLWISHKTNAPLSRLQPAGVWEIMQKIGRKAGVKRFTTHQLRHTAITTMHEAEVPALAVMKQAGHHGLGSQHIYGQVREKLRIQAVDAMEARVRRATGPRPVVLPKLPRYTRPRYPLS
jgi:integrase/recombinase XerD